MNLRGNLRARLATQHKSLRKSNLCALTTTCLFVWPGLKYRSARWWKYPGPRGFSYFFIVLVGAAREPRIGEHESRSGEFSPLSDSCFGALSWDEISRETSGTRVWWKMFADWIIGLLELLFIYSRHKFCLFRNGPNYFISRKFNNTTPKDTRSQWPWTSSVIWQSTNIVSTSWDFVLTSPTKQNEKGLTSFLPVV